MKLKFTFSKEKAKDFGKAAGLTLITIVAAVAKNSLEATIQAKANECMYKKSTYSSVISNIMNSDMWGSDKEKLLEMIPKDADAELYGSILAVLMSNDWSSSKVKMVRTLCDKVAIPTTAKIEDVEKEESNDEG